MTATDDSLQTQVRLEGVSRRYGEHWAVRDLAGSQTG